MVHGLLSLDVLVSVVVFLCCIVRLQLEQGEVGKVWTAIDNERRREVERMDGRMMEKENRNKIMRQLDVDSMALTLT